MFRWVVSGSLVISLLDYRSIHDMEIFPMNKPLIFVSLIAASVSFGCNNAGIGAGAGAGIGALAGQAIGGNTGSTLIGAGAGAAAGYVIGNEMDKSQAEKDRQRMQREIDENRRQSNNYDQ
tara:strand:+ start:393 stop:755 length:363 start_codon:yes stop_codon:yes gene_type:complete